MEEDDFYFNPIKKTLVTEFSGYQMFLDGRQILGICLFIIVLKVIARNKMQYNKLILSIAAFIVPAVFFIFTPEYNINSVLMYGFAGYIIIHSYRNKDEEAEKQKQTMLKYFEGREREAYEKGYDAATAHYKKP